MAKKVPDRQIAGLKAHAEAKNKETIDKVNKAIDILQRKNAPINFETVSKEAGVSRATIYNNEQLKERILSIRAMSKKSPLIMKITSAYANKLLKSLEEDKKFWENKEESSSTYVAANNEEPVIQEYDYREVSDSIAEIDSKIAILKHAINLNNVMAKIPVESEVKSVDSILIEMAQLNKRKAILDDMRKRNPKEREMMDRFMSRTSTVPEYRYINYDLDEVKDDYVKVSERIMKLQMALDKYNQTVEFEVIFN